MEDKIEELTFDKFMDDILLKESKKPAAEVEETPQRKYIRKYVERSSNRIRFGAK